MGYGDIAPQTVVGQIIATMAMLTGYSIIAIPTGIFTAEIAREINTASSNTRCNICELTDIAAGVTAGSIDFTSDLSGKNTGWNGNNRITREHCHSGNNLPNHRLRCNITVTHSGNGDYGPIDTFWNTGKALPVFQKVSIGP